MRAFHSLLHLDFAAESFRTFVSERFSLAHFYIPAGAIKTMIIWAVWPNDSCLNILSLSEQTWSTKF